MEKTLGKIITGISSILCFGILIQVGSGILSLNWDQIQLLAIMYIGFTTCLFVFSPLIKKVREVEYLSIVLIFVIFTLIFSFCIYMKVDKQWRAGSLKSILAWKESIPILLYIYFYWIFIFNILILFGLGILYRNKLKSFEGGSTFSIWESDVTDFTFFKPTSYKIYQHGKVIKKNNIILFKSILYWLAATLCLIVNSAPTASSFNINNSNLYLVIILFICLSSFFFVYSSIRQNRYILATIGIIIILFYLPIFSLTSDAGYIGLASLIMPLIFYFDFIIGSDDFFRKTTFSSKGIDIIIPPETEALSSYRGDITLLVGPLNNWLLQDDRASSILYWANEENKHASFNFNKFQLKDVNEALINKSPFYIKIVYVDLYRNVDKTLSIRELTKKEKAIVIQYLCNKSSSIGDEVERSN